MATRQKKPKTPKYVKSIAERYRLDWSDEVFKREFESAVRKGYLVIPTSRLREVELCNLAFEPAGRVDLPDCGHVILRLRPPYQAG